MFYIAVLILIGYLTFIFVKYKLIPTSLSDTFYMGAKWGFTAAMWAIGFLTAAGMLSVTPEKFLFLAFFSGAGLLFVGAAPYFKEDFVDKVHYCGAMVFILACLIWIALVASPYILINWVAMMYLASKSLRVFYAEMVAVLNLIIGYVVCLIAG